MRPSSVVRWRGVSPRRLANALCIDIGPVRKKMNPLHGIGPEAAGPHEDRQFSPEFSRVIRKMRPIRQVWCVELLISADTMKLVYAEALLAASPVCHLLAELCLQC